jgi:hypothetical protein
MADIFFGSEVKGDFAPGAIHNTVILRPKQG